LVVAGVTRGVAERLLSLIDGERSLAELRMLAGSDRPGLERLVQGALGSMLFAPEAVAELEHAISGTELVRFVGTPYEIVRSYWENMADVRRAAKASLPGVDSTERALRWLRRLHVVALLGHDLERFYRPASRIASHGVRPGALYTSNSERLETPERTLILSGPRVGVALVGGEMYHALVCAEDPEALLRQRTLSDPDGVEWGSVVYGRAVDDDKDNVWFCPPRPLLPAHFEKLFQALSNAREHAFGATRTDQVEELARFHYRFVRLHPFRAANQSLCMNLVNLLLSEQRGSTLPHLLLDQFALRLSESAYVRVFARAVQANAVNGTTAERWAELRDIKTRAYALIEQLKTASDLATARRLAEANPQAASAALIDVDSSQSARALT
jgi:hypothetical protein